MGYGGSRRIHLRGWIIQTSWAQIVTLLSPSPSFAPCRTWAEWVCMRTARDIQHMNMQVDQEPVPLFVFLKLVSAQRKYPSRNQTHWDSGNHNEVIVYERWFLPLTTSGFFPPFGVCWGYFGCVHKKHPLQHYLSQKIVSSRMYNILQTTVSLILGSADI